MIVVDTNVIAAYLLPAGEQSAAAAALFERDREWVAPLLWRSEFVALARLFEVPLVTLDRALLRAFPETAMALGVGS